ncbi:multiple inositol polyphosphate phosphatase 1-like [Spodoptera litura]|uniref:Multiple inositol polyphosphate phosphatase 1 n=1 Tax=Spodoptera litura TaxID=69820 RepID=A0A9J7IJD4_SPOLT|nr:multiple inositol polyphosphate phosphatase 1-like [Spodoptera litura]
MKFLIITAVCFCVKTVLTLDCYWNTGCKYKYFSSKTPYEIVRGDIRDSIVKQEECETISVWSMLRHGKRNPSQRYAEDMQFILKNYKDYIVSSYEIGNSSLCAQDVENIKNWKIDTSMLDEPNKLSNEGYREVLDIGRRIKETFPELLSNLRENEYKFTPGFGTRLEESAKAYIEGLNDHKLVITKVYGDYTFVAPYSTCGRYEVDVRYNPNIYHEAEVYETTEEYLTMRERVAKNLGFNFIPSNGNITAMYDLCRYSWNGLLHKPSPWCAVFTTEDFKILEYVGDLRHYYRNSYGVIKFSNVLGKLPMADLFRNFELAKRGNGRKIVSYFTHATMIDMLAVVFNLYKDPTPLMGSYRNVDRRYRSSFLSTFGSNLIAVLNRCRKAHNYDYSVSLYWNEKPLTEICNKGTCSWQEFEDIFTPFLNATDDICEFKLTQMNE